MTQPSRALRCRAEPAAFCHEHDHPGTRAPPAARSASLQGGRHRARPLQVIEGTRQRIQVFEGIVIKRQGAGVARDVHRPQELVRRRRRADVPAPLAEDRQDRRRRDRRREPREAVLPARQGRQEGPRPRAAPAASCVSSAADSATASGRVAAGGAILGRVAKRTGRKLLAFDRGSAAASSPAPTRRAAGRSPGRSSSPACCSTSACLRDHRARPLALLNDSKQVDPRRARSSTAPCSRAPSACRCTSSRPP